MVIDGDGFGFGFELLGLVDRPSWGFAWVVLGFNEVRFPCCWRCGIFWSLFGSCLLIGRRVLLRCCACK
jgi:hypothetical protein